MFVYLTYFVIFTLQIVNTRSDEIQALIESKLEIKFKDTYSQPRLLDGCVSMSSIIIKLNFRKIDTYLLKLIWLDRSLLVEYFGVI